MKTRVAVLISGSGSNLQALLDACRGPDFPAEVSVVVSNVPTAFGLTRAQRAGVPTEVVEHRAFQSRDAFEQALLEVLSRYRIEVVCLAGFMRVLSPTFVRAFLGKLLNVHPALLPAFPGMHGARQALDYGAKLAGCTVHFVDEGTDTGPIIAQAAVPVLPFDDEASLSARIQAQEHELYPRVLGWLCAGRLSLVGRTVKLADGQASSDASPALAWPRG